MYTRRTTRETAERVARAHGELLDRIEAGDAAGSRQSMCLHLEGVRARGFAGRKKKRTLS
jgi:DNA-binding GntR family transcriptional regulator